MLPVFLSKKLSFYKWPSEFQSIAEQVRECDGLALKRLRAATPRLSKPGTSLPPRILSVLLRGSLSVFLFVFLSCFL